MLREMSATEYAEWKYYSTQEPFGHPLALALADAERYYGDYRAGLLASIQHNSWRTKGAKALGPVDFFPNLAPSPADEPDPAALSDEERAARDAMIRQMAEMLNQAYHGRIEEPADVDGR